MTRTWLQFSKPYPGSRKCVAIADGFRYELLSAIPRMWSTVVTPCDANGERTGDRRYLARGVDFSEARRVANEYHRSHA